MNDETRLRYIRESERRSHEEMYSYEELFQKGSWLQKPIKTILDIVLFKLIFTNAENVLLLCAQMDIIYLIR